MTAIGMYIYVILARAVILKQKLHPLFIASSSIMNELQVPKDLYLAVIDFLLRTL